MRGSIHQYTDFSHLFSVCSVRVVFRVIRCFVCEFDCFVWNFVRFHVSFCLVILASSLLFLSICSSITVILVFCSSIPRYAIVPHLSDFGADWIYDVVIVGWWLFIVRVVGYDHLLTRVVSDTNLSCFGSIIAVRGRVSHLVAGGS